MKPLIVLVAAFALAGCAAPKAVSGKGTCLALAPHFPQRLSRLDTQMTKEEGHLRNVAYRAACPAQMPVRAKNRRVR